MIEFSEESGLIKCSQNPQLFFRMSEVIIVKQKKLQLNEKVEFSVVPVSSLSVLRLTPVCSTVLLCSPPFCCVLPCSTLFYCVLPCSTLFYSVPLRSAVFYLVPLCPTLFPSVPWCSTLFHSALSAVGVRRSRAALSSSPA